MSKLYFFTPLAIILILLTGYTEDKLKKHFLNFAIAVTFMCIAYFIDSKKPQSEINKKTTEENNLIRRPPWLV